jgi:deazaflavin-dependent oxidoreductase (nitroreductase family)
MAKLIYSAIASLDGYVEDEQGRFEWAAPDEEVLAFVNELERPIGTYLYGRRMYETMVFWETASINGDQSPGSRDFAEIWQAAEKIVYSRTLETVSSARTRIEREFNPDAIRRLKESSRSDITIGGAELAGQAIAESLVDECQLLLGPVLVGAGKRALPANVHAQLELLDERRFRSGVIYLHYRLGATTMSTAPQDFNARIIEEFRANEGRVGGMFEGSTLLLLHHVGAKSGEDRINPLAYNRDGDRYVVFASKAGAPTNPDWYHNLKAHPDVRIEVGTDTIEVRAEEATGEDRDRLFSAQAERSPQFAEYQSKTERVIPVIVLTPAG